jgi:hypothetical protein
MRHTIAGSTRLAYFRKEASRSSWLDPKPGNAQRNRHTALSTVSALIEYNW